MSTPSPRSDLLGGAGWAVLGSLILAESLRMDRFTSMGGTLYTMPGLVPGVLGGVLIAMGGALAWRGWRRMKQQAGDGATQGEPLLNRRIVLMGATTLTYAIGMVGRVPFSVATAIFVAVFVWLFTPADTSAVRRAVGALLAGLLTSLVVVLVFEQVFLVRLP